MPTALTFTSLQSDVRAYVERGSATYDETVYAQIPRIINLTERRIARELKIQGFQAVVNSQMTVDNNVYQKPDRWRETISINVGTNLLTATTYNQRVLLKELAYESITATYPDRTASGTPRYYADYNYNNWLFAPTPNQQFPFEVVYWQLPPLLDDTNQTNWLTEYAPNALLHGTLDELYGFLVNDSEKAKYKQEYDRDMAALSGEDLQKILNRYYKRTTA